MLSDGAVGIAMVQHRVTIVQSARSHTRRDGWLDVYTFMPFGERLFLETHVPKARIAPSDLLAIFPSSDVFHTPTQGMLQLPQKAFAEFTELTSWNQKRCEDLWCKWIASQ
ncbi:hypothetical protein ARMGADRAFT_1007961 [Armillaria gallica]|uniref:Uncharacterized protein n=1 Tax=Armillaria gallica TaxID=47427 RepID=A0A2H3DW14_ARMGA|nr:hypothetical protein ARMGADRAFT_1007961 [Armillaria gallica]